MSAIRRWILWILTIGFVWFVLARFEQLEGIGRVLISADWYWLILAACVQAVYYLVYTGLYQAAFYAVGVDYRLRELLPVTFAAIFVNVLASFGGVAGAALFVDDATQRGKPPGSATAGALLALFIDLATFFCVLAVGLGFLLSREELTTYEVMGAGVLFGLVALLGALLAAGLWKPHLLANALRWVQDLVTALAGKVGFSLGSGAADWSAKYACQLEETGRLVARYPTRLLLAVGVAFGAHALDILSVFCLFKAFGQAISLGVLVAGYGVAILFWIVSPTPQGIGVVEGAMALAYASLGIPAATGTLVALSFRGLTFWLPLFVGFFCLQRLKSFKGHVRLAYDNVAVHVVAGLVAIAGLVNVVLAVTPALAARLPKVAGYFVLSLHYGAHLVSALAGFGLLLLAGNLWKRKRVAWVLTLLLLAVSLASHLIGIRNYHQAAFSAVLLALLLFLKERFRAGSDAPSIKQGLLTLAISSCFTLFYGTLGFYLLDKHFSVNFTLGAALKQTLIMFVEFYDPGLEPITGFGRYFAYSIYTVGFVTFAYAMLMLFRPVLERRRPSPAEKQRAIEIVERWGRTSLARMALLDDKSFFFSSGGSLVSYVAKAGVGLALGDPIGPHEDLPVALDEFLAYCRDKDWSAAFYQTQPDALEAYYSAGMRAVCIGHEALVDLSTFTLRGNRGKSLRSSINRLQRAGCSTRLYLPPLDDHLLHELHQVSDAWLTLVKGAEKRFSLGWFYPEYIASCPVMTVQKAEGELLAFTNLVSEYNAPELTVDLMRYRPDAPSGTMDLLFARLFEWAQSQGYQTFNLGLSFLPEAALAESDQRLQKFLHFLYEQLDEFHNLEGLRKFKSKFHPRWSPRYLVYSGPAALPSLALALLEATSAESLWLHPRGWFGRKAIRRAN